MIQVHALGYILSSLMLNRKKISWTPIQYQMLCPQNHPSYVCQSKPPTKIIIDYSNLTYTPGLLSRLNNRYLDKAPYCRVLKNATTLINVWTKPDSHCSFALLNLMLPHTRKLNSSYCFTILFNISDMCFSFYTLVLCIFTCIFQFVL